MLCLALAKSQGVCFFLSKKAGSFLVIGRFKPVVFAERKQSYRIVKDFFQHSWIRFQTAFLDCFAGVNNNGLFFLFVDVCFVMEDFVRVIDTE